MKVLFVSTKREIIQDMEIAYSLGFDVDHELIFEDQVSNVENAIEKYQPALVLLTYDALIKRDSWNLKAETVYCARNENQLRKGAGFDLKTIGIAKDANEILNKLDEKPYYAKKEEPEQTKVKQEKEAVDLSGLFENEGRKEEEKPVEKKKETKMPVMEELPELDDDDFDDMENLQSEEIIQEEPTKVREKVSLREQETEAEEKDAIKKSFEKDLIGNKSQTKIIAVYSAKGGVGKTTIASELAMYLSLVDIGPRKLKVCIIDYNIDFGDVKSTLGMEKSTKSLTYWADEIREFLGKGIDPETIMYSREEIEQYLEKNERSGLWVLPAPVSNEDSMGIDSEELQVILRNLRDNGGFDYIICDTGNNTRDSTMIALENANTILMIMTQNVNTANCDISFMKTMETIDFDMSNTKLIINNIVPQKLTGISVEEIEKYFPFECVGKIHYNPDVMKATNLGEPLAFDPGHEFTKQMKDIVAFVLNDETMKAEPVPEKKGLFGFLKRKKKG